LEHPFQSKCEDEEAFEAVVSEENFEFYRIRSNFTKWPKTVVLQPFCVN